jgi:PAS domain S-box-containing protein
VIQDGRICWINQRMTEMGALTSEEVKQKAGEFFLNCIHPEDRGLVAERYFKRLRGEKVPSTYNVRLLRKDRESLCVDFTPVIITWDQRPATLCFVTDITERIQTDEERKKLQTKLAYSEKMESIGTLAGGIAHNFNNLLMAIQGNTSLILLDTDSNNACHRYAKNIEKQVKQGSELTSQLLGYAREGRYEIKPINLNQLVQRTAHTFGEAKKEIRLHMKLTYGPYGIKADQGQIEQVLLNLYVNAADAMPGGGDLFLETRNVTHEEMGRKPYEPKPGNYILLKVRDTGRGIDEETRDRIFEPFFTTKGLATGKGLGLASAYGIIRAHGGYIDVESEEGQGTTFKVYLPATENHTIAVNDRSDEILRGKETILLVDDEEMIIETGEQMLERMGYQVLMAKGGLDAVALFRKKYDSIDMVLLDMVMPDIDGGECYDRMKEIDPDVKVLLSSGYSIDGKATEILERGCNAFIQKPFNMKQLSQSIRQILDY